METVDHPKEIAQSCICFAMRRAARTVARLYDDGFHDLGINNGQFTILLFASANRDVTISELSHELAMDRTTLTAALKPLERDALIQVRPHKSDGRARLVVITKQGKDLLKKALPRWRQSQAEALKSLSSADVDQFRSNLRKFC